MSAGGPATTPRQQAREVLGDVAWGRLALWWAASFAVGAVLGLLFMASGWWTEGADWERALLALVQQTVNPYLDPILLWVPYLGTNYSLAPITAVAAFWLWRHERHAAMLHLVAIQLGSWALNPALKLVLARPRPELYELRGQYALPAYPSGHSIAVTSVLFTAAYLIHRSGYGTWAYWVAAAIFVVNTYSRLYLAVHWPTDVVGGTAVGLIWLVAGLVVFEPVHRRHTRA
ncbi:MAG: phosphatase PAP2 family protein [Longimicrobiales bacterium]